MQTNGIEDSYSYSHLVLYKYIHFYFAKKYTLVGNQLYLSHFAIAVVRQPDHRNIRKEGFIQLTAQDYSPSFWGNDSSRSLGQLVPLHAQRPVSQVAMDLIRFTIEINHHDPFQQTVLAKLDISVQKVEQRSPPLVLQKTNPKWTNDFNIRPKTLKPLKKRIEKSLQDIIISKDFLKRIPVTQEIRAIRDKSASLN